MLTRPNSKSNLLLILITVESCFACFLFCGVLHFWLYRQPLGQNFFFPLRKWERILFLLHLTTFVCYSGGWQTCVQMCANTFTDFMCSLARWLTSLCYFIFIKWASQFCFYLRFMSDILQLHDIVTHAPQAHLWVLLKYLHNEVNRCLTQAVCVTVENGDNDLSETKKGSGQDGVEHCPS